MQRSWAGVARNLLPAAPLLPFKIELFVGAIRWKR